MDHHSFWLGMGLAAAVCGLVLSVLQTAQAIEHRRFVRRRRGAPVGVKGSGRVAVLAPCKGVDVGLDENLRPLFEQDHPDYELVFVVESAADAACEVIGKLREAYPQVRARLVVAGRATRSGQKVHNLRVATADLAPEIRYLAFVDSDARPPRDWLRRLVQRLDRRGTGAVTGYRWFIPLRPTWPNHLLYSINAAVATMFGAGKHQLLWGGAWAVGRETFQRLGIRQAWQGKLNDDLAATRIVQQAGLRIEFEPSCVVASPIDVRFGELLGFVRRQYVQGRCHVRHWWALALVGCWLSNTAVWGCAAAAVWGAATAAPWTWLPAWLAAMAGLLGVWRATIRGDLALIHLGGLAQRRSLQAAARFDVWGWPLAGAVHAWGLLASAVGRGVTWRHIRYRLRSDGSVAHLRRLRTATLEAEARMEAAEPWRPRSMPAEPSGLPPQPESLPV